MKLRHQLIALLVVPVVCQLGTVAVLVEAVSGVDKAAVQEMKAKEVINTSQEMLGLLGSSVLQMTGAGFAKVELTEAGVLDITQLMKQKLARMQELTKDNPKASKILERLHIEIARFLENWRDLIGSWKPGQTQMFFAQFFFKDEAFESLKVMYLQIRQDNLELSDMYRPMAKELRPEAVQARSKLRDAIIMVIGANILLVASLAVLVHRTSLTRLQTLMNNIRAFSKGEKTLQKLSGKDELAELDDAFREMSEERWRLDELQKSLRAMVSHDLRSPLTSMSLSLDALQQSERFVGLDASVQKTISRVSSETHRLSRLARTLLDIEKLEGGHIVVDANTIAGQSLVDSSTAAVAALAERRKMVIETQIEPDLMLHCDDERTIQSLVNLLSNSIKFAPQKSTITVKAYLKEMPNSQPVAQIEVIDAGPGIPPAQAESLFSKFKQLDQSESTKKEGSGLGLYICRLLIEAQGGKIGYLAPGETGSCFWFTLPIATAEQTTSETTST